MFKDNLTVDLLLFERKTTVNKFYALMITAGVIASGVVGDFEDAPSERLCYFDYERSVLSQKSRKNSGRR